MYLYVCSEKISSKEYLTTSRHKKNIELVCYITWYLIIIVQYLRLLDQEERFNNPTNLQIYKQTQMLQGYAVMMLMLVLNTQQPNEENLSKP